MFEPHQEISPVDILYILENPWEKSKGEWLLANESERQETLQFILGRLKLTENNGFKKMWKTQEDKPIALLGAFKVEDKKYETFLICSRLMEAHSIKLSFDMRKLLKELPPRFNGCTLGQYAEAGNTHQISWLRFLGFKYRPEGNKGNSRYYEFVASIK